MEMTGLVLVLSVGLGQAVVLLPGMWVLLALSARRRDKAHGELLDAITSTARRLDRRFDRRFDRLNSRLDQVRRALSTPGSSGGFLIIGAVNGVNGGEMAIVIKGTREDWPRGTRTLTPHDPIREPNGRTLWFGAGLEPDGEQVWFRLDDERVVCGRGRDPTLSRYPTRGAAFRASEDPARAMRASDPAFRVDQHHSIVVVAGRMVRVRRQASTNLRTRSSAPVVALHSRSRFATAGPAGPPLPATPASRRATATSRWTCSATPCRRPGVDDAVNLYHDFASGLRDDRPGLDSCLQVLRKGDVLHGLEARPPRPQSGSSGRGVRSAPPGRRAPAGPRRGPTDPARCLTRGRPARVRHLRGAGRVRAEADPRTHRGRAQGRTGPRSQGREEVRAVESPSAAGPGRDGAPRHVGVRTVPRTQHQASDALPVRRPAGPAARAGPRRSSPPESKDRDAGRA